MQTQTVTANGQADWIKGGETITEFTFTAASGGGCRAESMGTKLDEDPTEDNETGERAAPSRISGFVVSADLWFRRLQLVVGGLSAEPVFRLLRWRPTSVDESRSQGGKKLSDRDGKKLHIPSDHFSRRCCPGYLNPHHRI